MKSLHMITSRLGGAGIAATRINEALVSVGVESTMWDRNQILSELNFGISEQLKMYVASPVLTLFQSRFIQKGSELMTPNSLSLVNFSKFKNLDFDVLHVHSFYNLLNAESFHKLSQLNKPVVVTLHDLRLITGGCHAETNCKNYEIDCTKCPKVRRAFRSNVANQKKKMTTYIQESSNIVLVSPSEWLSRRILVSGNFLESKVKVINNPVPECFEFAREGRGQKGMLVIGFSAHDLQSPYKGLDILLAAIRSLPPQIQSRINLHLKGNNFPNKSYFFGLHASIFNDSEVQMSDFYKGVDAIVVPSLADNFPSVAIEAIASNCLLISSDSGGLREISESNNGFVFANKNYTQLAEILIKLINEENLLQSKYDRKYSFYNVGMQYKKLYSEITR